MWNNGYRTTDGGTLTTRRLQVAASHPSIKLPGALDSMNNYQVVFTYGDGSFDFMAVIERADSRTKAIENAIARIKEMALEDKNISDSLDLIKSVKVFIWNG